MAGNPATAPTPGANQQAGNTPTPGQDPQSGDNQQQQQTPAATPGIQQHQPAPFIMNQEQFNQRWAEKHADIEKDLGMPLKDAKALIESTKKPPAPATSTETLTGAELRMAKMEALMLAGVPSKKIPGLLSRVQGKSKADIEADIKLMVADGFIIIQGPKPAAQPQQQQQQMPATTPTAAQGAGNTGVPASGEKTFTESQIAAMSPEEYEKNRDAIFKAMEAGAIKKG